MFLLMSGVCVLNLQGPEGTILTITFGIKKFYILPTHYILGAFRKIAKSDY
jgi:hypothetical protein